MKPTRELCDINKYRNLVKLHPAYITTKMAELWKSDICKCEGKKNLYLCLKRAGQSHPEQSLMGRIQAHVHDIYDWN
jgi:hypothetical protein